MREVTANVSFEQPADASLGAFLIRYGLGALMILDGVVMLIVSPGGLGVDGFAMAVGGGLSVVLFNCLFRLSLSSESDRAQEERARAYFDQSWRVTQRGARQQRRWVLPAGAVTHEQEQAQQQARRTAGSAVGAMAGRAEGRRGDCTPEVEPRARRTRCRHAGHSRSRRGRRGPLMSRLRSWLGGL